MTTKTLNLIFDEVGCDWIICAEVHIPEDCHEDEFIDAVQDMVEELNAGLRAFAGGPLTRVGVKLESKMGQ